MPKLVFLWTDVVLSGCSSRSPSTSGTRCARPTLRADLAQGAARSRRRCPRPSCWSLFLAIALLDCVHFRPLLPPAPGAAADAPPAYATRTLSLLDALLAGPRRVAREDLLGAARHAPVFQGVDRWSTASRCATVRGCSSAARTCRTRTREWARRRRCALGRGRWSAALAGAGAAVAASSPRCAARARTAAWRASLRAIWRRTHGRPVARDAADRVACSRCSSAGSRRCGRTTTCSAPTRPATTCCSRR